MTRRVIRHELPIVDGPTELPWFPGPVLHVDARGLETVELWTEQPQPGEGRNLVRSFVVVGTGHVIPDGGRHVGSVVSPSTEGPVALSGGGVMSVRRGQLVWHVFEVEPVEPF